MRLFAACLFLVACGGGMTKEAAAQQVDQLLTLWSDDRSKFVVQKQEIIQADDCERAEKLLEAINEKAQQAAMQPGDTSAITMVQMELQQAERECKAK